MQPDAWIVIRSLQAFYTSNVPFPDELAPTGVRVLGYQQEWADEAHELTVRLRALVPDAVVVEHIGSTSIPGMSAKDCLDMMIVVADLDTTTAGTSLTEVGYRRRPEPWNNDEPAQGRLWPKMVFAPPEGGRAVNIHVRLAGVPTTRVALLFRDFLRASPGHARTWAHFKIAAAEAADDLAAYGAIKEPAWRLLMDLAEQWSTETGWSPDA
ncbi:GrpB family protein [Flexivirga endophytica]|uniref:GrpB family protein n=1 Tax=Flexivirga endophytica TaxID=1849103 RepID=UPI001E504921|nr:GrpB family protein [Flexivirga endophytica]